MVGVGAEDVAVSRKVWPRWPVKSSGLLSIKLEVLSLASNGATGRTASGAKGDGEGGQWDRRSSRLLPARRLRRVCSVPA